MSKYQPLSDHLAARTEDEWPASFSELEAVLGFPLPKAARAGRAWWANEVDKNHSRAWTAHGWEVGDVDHAAERVVFRRGAASGQALVQAARLKPLEEPARGASAPVRPVSEKVLSPPARSRGPGVAVLATGAAALAGLAALAIRTLARRGRA